MARFTDTLDNNQMQELVSVPAEIEKELEEEETLANKDDIEEFSSELILEVTDIRKAIHTGLAKPPGIKIDVHVRLSRVAGIGDGTFYVTLKTSEENFGTQEIYWQESLQGMGISWAIEPDSLAFTELQTNKLCSDIFKVEISSETTADGIVDEEEDSVGGEGAELNEKQDVTQTTQEAITVIPPSTTLAASDLEKFTFQLINEERERNGATSTKWDDRLYELSKKHTEKMAERGEIFHSPYGADYGENCWGGKGYYHYSDEELSYAIVESWMSSPLHRAWLLHAPIKESVVSIVITPDGQYASWSFWISKLASGPKLVEEISREWEATSGGMPWIEWLYMKGYLK